jgi:hypothetical protein
MTLTVMLGIHHTATPTCASNGTSSNPNIPLFRGWVVPVHMACDNPTKTGRKTDRQEDNQGKNKRIPVSHE